MKKSNYILYFFCCVIVLIFCECLFIWNLYLHTETEIGENAINITRAVANMLDVKAYEKIAVTKKRDDYFYKIQGYFKKTADETKVKYLYVSRYISDKKIEYIFDSSQDSLGQTDDNIHPYVYKTKESTIEKLAYYKKWGTLITGNTPLLDNNGKLIGLVGVDIDLTHFNTILFNHERPSLLFGLVVLILLIAMLFFNLNTRYTQKVELIKFYKKSFNMLAEGLSQKSDFTWKHSVKVSCYAEILAKCIGLKSQDVQIISWASLLHDIGKLGISDKILNKAEALTAEEYEEIKKHPQYSREILSHIFEENHDFLDINEYKLIIDIVSYHHERWDGKGYPYRLAGNEIPLSARIVGFADSLEAMLAERPYKKSLDKQLVLQEIKTNSGKQFDPFIVEVFFDCLKNGLIEI